MKKAIYSGSFDPVTVGHIDIIKRSAQLFDEVTVLVASSTSKKYLFSIDERKKLIKEALVGANVKVESYDGLIAKYIENTSINIIIRGVRTSSDFEYEMGMANVNKQLNSKIETLLLIADPKLSSISSTVVREIAKLGGDVSSFVSPNVCDALKNKFNSKAN